MSVDDRNVVDGIGVEKTTSIVALTLSDHRTWGDTQHLHALQDKLNDYFRFIESGQLLQSYPLAVGKTLRIDVVCQFAPDDSGIRLLKMAREVAESAGWSLSWVVLDDAQQAIQGDGPASGGSAP
jgi:hypothetical protein